jgi:2-C-methyl-D-erythritol 4-phosphate cytidylyltransferase
MPRTVALIPAAGRGLRAGSERNKLLLPLDGMPVLQHTVRALHDHAGIDAIVVIAADGDVPDWERVFHDRERWYKLLPWVRGGEARQDSVWNGLASLEAAAPEHVVVHDGARPFLSPALIDRVLAGLRRAPAAVPLVPIVDTVRRITEQGAEVMDRDHLFRTQTPQGFHFPVLFQAHTVARDRGLRGTDDAQIVEAAGGPVAFVDGEARNIKLTAGSDFQWGAWILAHPEWGD